MKKYLTIFLQILIVILGIVVLGLMLWEPHFEGRNIHATVSQIYFNDPFLAYVYIASITFFFALYQVFKLLGYVRQNKLLSQASVDALRTIKYCAIALIGFIMGAEAYFFVVMRGKDDITGGVMMGFIMIVLSIIVAITATVFKRRLRNSATIKPKGNLPI